MATHFSILHNNGESGILQKSLEGYSPWGYRVGHNSTHTHTHTHTKITGLPWWLTERFYVHFTQFPQWQHSEQLQYDIITGILILVKSTDHIQILFSILYFLKFSFILTVYLLGYGIYYRLTSPPHPHLGVSNMESDQVFIIHTKCCPCDMQCSGPLLIADNSGSPIAYCIS